MVDKEETKIETEAVAEEDQTVEVQIDEPKTEDSPAQEVADDPTQAEEIDNYSKGVQERIKKLTQKYRQEERDREEAQRLSQKLLEENKGLKDRMKNLDQGYLMEYGTRLESQEDQAKRLYKEAHEAGDTDKMVEAQQALAKIAIEQERYRMAKGESEVQKEDETPQAPTQPAPQAPTQPAPQAKVSEKAKTWAEKNEWFGSDNTMTYAAFGIHKRMVEEEGFDPETDEYYSEIDKRMKDEFPHKFNRKTNGNGAQVASAAASASRNTKQGRRSVKLTPSQIAMAKRLNVPLEEYARYVKD
mgnify:FL=1